MKKLTHAVRVREALTLVVASATLVACAHSPRSAPPTNTWHVTSGLDEAANCSLARLNKGVKTKEKGALSPASNSLRVLDPGKEAEIVPQPTPGIDGEPYFVRFTAEPGGTKIDMYSYLTWGKPVREALSPCVKSLAASQPSPAPNKSKK